MFSHKHICLWAELFAWAAKEEPDPPWGWSQPSVHTAQGIPMSGYRSQIRPSCRCWFSWTQLGKLAGLQSAFSEKLHPSSSAPSTHTQTKKIRRTTGHPSIQNADRLGPYRQTNQEGRTPNNNNKARSFGLTGWPSRELAEMLKQYCRCGYMRVHVCTCTLELAWILTATNWLVIQKKQLTIQQANFYLM